jgi:hypothetical protein
MPKGSQGQKRPAGVIGAGVTVGKIATAEMEETKAEARLKSEKPEHLPKEVNGPSGPEPTRFGDWERKGIASDF